MLIVLRLVALLHLCFPLPGLQGDAQNVLYLGSAYRSFEEIPSRFIATSRHSPAHRGKVAGFLLRGYHGVA